MFKLAIDRSIEKRPRRRQKVHQHRRREMGPIVCFGSHAGVAAIFVLGPLAPRKPTSAHANGEAAEGR